MLITTTKETGWWVVQPLELNIDIVKVGHGTRGTPADECLHWCIITDLIPETEDDRAALAEIALRLGCP